MVRTSAEKIAARAPRRVAVPRAACTVSGKMPRAARILRASLRSAASTNPDWVRPVASNPLYSNIITARAPGL